MADQRTYNARVTTEALEKKFRDTFPSQAGAELVDDLYASGVIVPTVDFTAAAQGSELREDLQKAWDLSTGSFTARNNVRDLASTSGFYSLFATVAYTPGVASPQGKIFIQKAGQTVIWDVQIENPGVGVDTSLVTWQGCVFLESGALLRSQSSQTNLILTVNIRQIATSSGDLINPLGFSFS